MELHGDEPRMSFQFDDFYQLPIGRRSGDAKSGRFELISKCRVEFVTMSVPLDDGFLPVALAADAVRSQGRFVHAKPHGSTLLRDLNLLFQQSDDGIRGIGVVLRCVFQNANAEAFE